MHVKGLETVVGGANGGGRQVTSQFFFCICLVGKELYQLVDGELEGPQVIV